MYLEIAVEELEIAVVVRQHPVAQELERNIKLKFRSSSSCTL